MSNVSDPRKRFGLPSQPIRAHLRNAPLHALTGALYIVLSVASMGGSVLLVGCRDAPPSVESPGTSGERRRAEPPPDATGPRSQSALEDSTSGGGPGDAGPDLLGAFGPRSSLDSFIAACGKAVKTWRVAQLSYPRALEMRMHVANAYEAAVDVTDAPVPAEKLIGGATPASAPIAVSCGVRARLVSVDGTMRISPEEWSERSFGVGGIVRWAWSVTPSRSARHDLRLELQPTAVIEGGQVLLSGGETTPFITSVVVQASLVQRAVEWFDHEWPLVAKIAPILGAALLGLLAFSERLRKALKKAFGRARRSSGGGGGGGGKSKSKSPPAASQRRTPAKGRS